jgi:hypothetical protein
MLFEGMRAAPATPLISVVIDGALAFRKLAR